MTTIDEATRKQIIEMYVDAWEELLESSGIHAAERMIGERMAGMLSVMKVVGIDVEQIREEAWREKERRGTMSE